MVIGYLKIILHRCGVNIRENIILVHVNVNSVFSNGINRLIAGLK